MNETRITFQDEGLDELGTEFSSVGVASGDLIATHTSFRRGGCLYAGTAVLRNFRTGAYREVDLTSRASASDAHARYLVSLAQKHVGDPKRFPVYRASRGGQDVYVEDVEARTADEALRTFAAANGVEGTRENVGDHARIQTAGVLYYYVYRS